MIKEIFLVSFAMLALTAAYPAAEAYPGAVQQLGPLNQPIAEVEDFETAESGYGGYRRGGHGHGGGHHGGYGHHGGGYGGGYGGHHHGGHGHHYG